MSTLAVCGFSAIKDPLPIRLLFLEALLFIIANYAAFRHGIYGYTPCDSLSMLSFCFLLFCDASTTAFPNAQPT
jgi:hypothetical protein